jgi:hypothetical protein
LIDGFFGIGKPQPKTTTATKRKFVSIVIVLASFALIAYLLFRMLGYESFAEYAENQKATDTATSKGQRGCKNRIQTRTDILFLAYSVSLLAAAYLISGYLRRFDSCGSDQFEVMVQLYKSYASAHSDDRKKVDTSKDNAGDYEKEVPEKDSCCCCCSMSWPAGCSCCKNTSLGEVKGFWTAKSTLGLLGHVIQYPGPRFLFFARLQQVFARGMMWVHVCSWWQGAAICQRSDVGSDTLALVADNPSFFLYHLLCTLDNRRQVFYH